MASSFVRAAKGPSRIAPPGTRPGLHGQTIISTGLPDLDQILGGGLPLGAILLVLEDSFAPHHLVLLRYFLAQGAAHGQSLLFASPLPAPRAFLGTLPAVASQEGGTAGTKAGAEKVKAAAGSQVSEDGLRIAWQYRRFISEQDALEARRQRQLSHPPSSAAPLAPSSPPPPLPSSSPPLAASPPPPPGPPNEAAPSSPSPAPQLDPGAPPAPAPHAGPPPPPPPPALASEPPSSSSHALPMEARPTDASAGGAPRHGGPGLTPVGEFCSTFDLRKPIERTTLRGAHPQCFRMGPEEGGLPALHRQCKGFLSKLASQSEGGGLRVGRIAIQSLGAPQSQLASPDAAWEMLAWLHTLRGQLRANQAAALVTFPAALYPPSTSIRVQHLADAVLSVEALQEEDKAMAGVVADYGDALGLLRIHKLPSLHTLVPLVPETSTYAMKVVRRRKVVLEGLHPLPVDVTPGESGSKSSAASLLCAGPQSGTSSLDF